MLLLFYFTVIMSPTCTKCLDQRIVVVVVLKLILLLLLYFSPALGAWTKEGGLSKLAGGEIYFEDGSKTRLLSFFLFCFSLQISFAIYPRCEKLHIVFDWLITIILSLPKCNS